MRKMLVIAGLLLLTSGIARASCDNFQPVEVGGAYDYVRVNTGMTVKSGSGSSTAIPVLNLNGWGAEVVYNPACVFGIVAEFGGTYGTTSFSIPDPNLTTHVYSYVFGPRLNLRNASPFTPFAEALFGGAHVSFSVPNLGSITQNGFEGNFGGGVDINLGDHWAIRPKADYVLTHFNSQSQNNALVSVGIVYKFGKH